jgi:hypothetical protein
MLLNVASAHEALLTMLWAVVTAFATGIAGVAGKHAFTWGFSRVKTYCKKKRDARQTHRRS